MDDKDNNGVDAQSDPRMPDTTELIISASPHLHSGESIQKIMFYVILSLMPACAVGIYYFGFNALKVIILCTLSCMAVEEICTRIVGSRSTLGDGSAVVTGILLAMNLSAGVPWWICVIGSVLAIGLGKQLYGGLGYNPFNPALVARVGLLIGFPKIMTTWVAPQPHIFISDAVTCATPLGIVKTAVSEGGNAAQTICQVADAKELVNYAIGFMPGCLGETSALALMAGGLALIIMKIIRWQVPVAFIASVALITGLVHHFNPAITPPASFHILTGGLFLGAFFMATDMVTSPMTSRGALIFGLGCGTITALIRVWGSYPEGVSFSILIMNAFTPLIDRLTSEKPFGMRKPQKPDEGGK